MIFYLITVASVIGQATRRRLSHVTDKGRNYGAHAFATQKLNDKRAITSCSLITFPCWGFYTHITNAASIASYLHTRKGVHVTQYLNYSRALRNGKVRMRRTTALVSLTQKYRLSRYKFLASDKHLQQ